MWEDILSPEEERELQFLEAYGYTPLDPIVGVQFYEKIKNYIEKDVTSRGNQEGVFKLWAILSSVSDLVEQGVYSIDDFKGKKESDFLNPNTFDLDYLKSKIQEETHRIKALINWIETEKKPLANVEDRFFIEERIRKDLRGNLIDRKTFIKDRKGLVGVRFAIIEDIIISEDAKKTMIVGVTEDGQKRAYILSGEGTEKILLAEGELTEEKGNNVVLLRNGKKTLFNRKTGQIYSLDKYSNTIMMGNKIIGISGNKIDVLNEEGELYASFSVNGEILAVDRKTPKEMKISVLSKADIKNYLLVEDRGNIRLIEDEIDMDFGTFRGM